MATLSARILPVASQLEQRSEVCVQLNEVVQLLDVYKSLKSVKDAEILWPLAPHVIVESSISTVCSH